MKTPNETDVIELTEGDARGSHQRLVRGSTPELSDASTGWWWLWCDEQWCASYVRNEKSKLTQEERLDVTWLRPAGGVSRMRLLLKEAQAEKWGGRIAAPNAEVSDQRGAGSLH